MIPGVKPLVANYAMGLKSMSDVLDVQMLLVGGGGLPQLWRRCSTVLDAAPVLDEAKVLSVANPRVLALSHHSFLKTYVWELPVPMADAGVE